MEQRLVSPETTPQDVAIAGTLRPKTFSEFIGQQEVVERLFIAAKAAADRNEPIDHMVFVGETGLGKTTLARLVGGIHMQETSAANLSDAGISNAMCDIVIRGDKAPALFLDELHSIKKSVAESLYPVMEDGILLAGMSSVGLKVPKFTLIGATTSYGKVQAPLRNRFIHVFRVKPYSSLDLTKILLISRTKLDVDANEPAIVDIAGRSRGTPRLANRFLKIVRDYAKSLDENIVNKAFSDMGIDKNGLDEIDRQYLSELQRCGKPLGVSTLSSLLGITEEEIEQVIEPYLLRQGYAMKTPRGRIIDSRGRLALRGK